ncbi:hypothetical protein KZ829_07320 [Actinoplanes hulinensis]|uniref:SMP domain-containing protein n=1 Tax=Actinoplanes hulinensis TaxID=1144547 RepID=A0ABS7AZQ8_9ACTN|nr:hypothetical protein [Actinoplanes hulinensis]
MGHEGRQPGRQAAVVVDRVRVGDVVRPAGDVGDRPVQPRQAVVLQVAEQAAVPEHGGVDPGVGARLQGLQPAARLAHHRDPAGVQAATVFAADPGVLRDGPVDGLDQHVRVGAAGAAGTAVRDHQEAV